MKVDWSEWSEPILRLLGQLHLAPPKHETQVRWDGARSNTITAAINNGLVVRIYLAEQGREHLTMPFLCLTQYGQAVKRDWIRWHGDVKRRLGSVPAFMDAVAELRL